MSDIQLYRKPNQVPDRSVDDLISKNVLDALKRDPPSRQPLAKKGKGVSNSDMDSDLLASMAKRLGLLERQGKESKQLIDKLKAENEALKNRLRESGGDDMGVAVAGHAVHAAGGRGGNNSSQDNGLHTEVTRLRHQIVDMKAYMHSHGLEWPGDRGADRDVIRYPAPPPEVATQGSAQPGTRLAPQPPEGVAQAVAFKRRSSCSGSDGCTALGQRENPLRDSAESKEALQGSADKHPLRKSSDKVAALNGGVDKGCQGSAAELEGLDIVSKRVPINAHPVGSSKLVSRAPLGRVPSAKLPHSSQQDPLPPMAGRPARHSVSSMTDIEAGAELERMSPSPLRANMLAPLPESSVPLKAPQPLGRAPLPSTSAAAESFLGGAGGRGQSGSASSNNNSSNSSSSSNNNSSNNNNNNSSSSSSLAFSMQKLMAGIEELNQLVGDGCAKVMAGTKGGHVLKTQEAVRLVVYEDGMQLHRSPAKLWKEPSTQNVLRDIYDAYFPAVLKQEFPDGVPIWVIERTGEKIPAACSAKEGHGNVLTWADLENKAAPAVSKQDFLSMLPKSVMKNGKVIDIRSGVASVMSGQGCDAAAAAASAQTAAPPKAAIISTPTDDLLDTRQRQHVGPVLPPATSATAGLASSREVGPAQEVATLQVKNEDGSQSYILKLKYEDTIAMLRKCIDAHRVKLGSGTNKGYEIRSAFPARNYADPAETLRVAGLIPNATLFLRAV